MFDNRKYVENAKKRYKKGMKVVLDEDMNDDSPYAPKKGESGIIRHVDDMGTVHVDWESGSSLGLILDEDEFHVIFMPLMFDSSGV